MTKDTPEKRAEPSEPLFDDKRAASIIRHHLMDELHKLQQNIIHVERFGDESVLHPSFQINLGPIIKLPEMKARHEELVRTIKRLSAAIEAADNIEIKQMVASIRERHGGNSK